MQSKSHQIHLSVNRKLPCHLYKSCWYNGQWEVALNKMCNLYTANLRYSLVFFKNIPLKRDDRFVTVTELQNLSITLICISIYVNICVSGTLLDLNGLLLNQLIDILWKLCRDKHVISSLPIIYNILIKINVKNDVASTNVQHVWPVGFVDSMSRYFMELTVTPHAYIST